jgi:hypothetical protein
MDVPVGEVAVNPVSGSVSVGPSELSLQWSSSTVLPLMSVPSVSLMIPSDELFIQLIERGWTGQTHSNMMLGSLIG